VNKLTKKQKFITLLVIGGIIIISTFIWSMYINLSQLLILESIPKVSVPDEISDIINDTNKPINDNVSTELQNITQILEEEQIKSLDLQQDKNEPNKLNIGLDLDSTQE